MKQNRLKSPVFWSSLASQVLTVLVLTGVIGSAWSAPITGIITAVLQILTIFGLLNNPTDSENF